MKPVRDNLRTLIRNHKNETLLLAAILAYTAVFTYATYQKHYTFTSYAWDLGVFNQLLHDTLFEGKPLYYTPDLYFNSSGSYLVIHFSPILLLLPIYYLLPGVQTLLFVKTLLLASATVPLYLLTDQHIKDKRISLTISLTYLLYLGLQGANWFDFQQQAFIPLLLFTTLYLFTKETWAPYAITVTLTFLVFELSFAIVIISLLCLQAYIKPREILTQLRQHTPNKAHVTVLTTLLGVVYYYAAKWFMSGYTINPLFRQQYLPQVSSTSYNTAETPSTSPSTSSHTYPTSFKHSHTTPPSNSSTSSSSSGHFFSSPSQRGRSSLSYSCSPPSSSQTTKPTT